MNSTPQLSASDQSLFIEMLCCIAAADKKLSGKEVKSISDALATAGCHSPQKELEAEIVKYCQAIHKQTPERYVDANHFRFQTEATSAVTALFLKAQQPLMSADGGASDDEVRISKRLSDLLAARQDTDKKPAPDQDANREPWKVALAIALFFPLGLYWLWKHPTLSKRKTWWRGAVAYAVIISILGAVDDRTKSRSRKQGQSLSSRNDDSSVADSDRTYKVKRGVFGDSVTVVTGGDVGLNLELSGIKWDGPKLKMRVKWIRGDRPPWRYNVTAYDAKEEVVQTAFLSCPLVKEGRQGDTFIGEIYLGPDAARTAKEIRIHM